MPGNFASKAGSLAALIGAWSVAQAQSTYKVDGRPDQIVAKEGQLSIRKMPSADPATVKLVAKVPTTKGTGTCIIQFSRSPEQDLLRVDSRARAAFEANGLPAPVTGVSSDWERQFRSMKDDTLLTIVYYEQRGTIQVLYKTCNAIGQALIAVQYSRF